MKTKLILVSFLLACLASCVKDRIGSTSSGPVNIGNRKLIHYWSFNFTSDTTQMRMPDTTIGGGRIDYVAGYIDSVHPGSELNVRQGNDSGGALRVRNPYTSMTIHMPTTGFKQAILTLAVERSNSGPSANAVLYTTDGTTFQPAPTNLITIGTTWALVSVDFSSLSATDNNPNFAIQFVPTSGNTGTSGNDRFDNITLDAFPQ